MPGMANRAANPEPGTDLDSFREAGHALVELVADHLAGQRELPVWRPTDEAARARLLDRPLPERGTPLAELVREFETDVLPWPMGNAHPRFFGWVNAAPAPAGVLGELAAAGMNPSSAGGDHADVHLERTVVRWIAELVGFPHLPGGGLLTSGASMATIVALGAARRRATERAGHDVRADGLSGLPPLIGYVTGETHSCVLKAAELLGLGSRNLRRLPGAPDGRMDPEALRAAITADRAAGLLPCFAAASAGTVNTGAVDPLDAIADVCAASGVWLHVDGAYGAFGALDPGLTARYRGLERADSLALDPHKWLGVPVDCGCLLVRDPDGLRGTFSLVPPYLRDEEGDGLGWFSEYGIEQTRPFRSLKVWATLAHAGREGVVRAVSRCTELARRLGELVEDDPQLELLAPVETSVAAFRYRPEGVPEKALQQVNQALPQRVQRRGRTFVTGTVIGGVEASRACLLNAETTEEDLTVLLAEVREAGRELLGELG
jgi:glutamate/tyrosine decarboxylase-like PLP-dependent enzyme